MMLDLALHSSELETLSNIAKRQEVSARYLEQIASDLRKAGFIQSHKGAQGGYELTMLPEKITVKNLIIAMEGDIRLTDEPTKSESLLEKAIRESVYDPMNSKVDDLLVNITIQDLMDEYYKRNDILMYNI